MNVELYANALHYVMAPLIGYKKLDFCNRDVLKSSLYGKAIRQCVTARGGKVAATQRETL